MQFIGDFQETVQPQDSSTFELSYLGDAWYEFWCRRLVLQQTKNPAKVHQLVVNLVRCQTQSGLVRLLLPSLTKEEEQIYRRGRNNKMLSSPKHATMKEYRDATGFECLLGFWFQNHQTNRFDELIKLEPAQQFLKKMLEM